MDSEAAPTAARKRLFAPNRCLETASATNMARLSEHGIRLSSMSPSFLSSNSTSHTWPFSAVAELVDNASDAGVSAKQIWIDITDEGGHLFLTFTDNGNGMTPNRLHKMLSFGFTEKGSGKARQQAMGVYGNGFKSGSMRLGSDALIFTKNGGCQTVGMLSQTYLQNIKAQAVIVPIDSEASLAAILHHSLITSVEQIHAHFDSIPSKKGTKILIWNIRRAKDGKPELDFETDDSDFRLPMIQIEEVKKGLRSRGSLGAKENIPEMHYSLKAYLSILYLKPRTQIILRGKKIFAKLVAKRLKQTKHDVYKPHFSKDKVKVTFGLNPKNKDHYGIMMYHKNRLIKAYEKVGCQMKSSGQRAGVGVIGVIECNFLKPAHNKQDFEYTKEYRLTLGALGLKLSSYWKEVIEKKAREREVQALDRENEGRQKDDEGPTWLQCGECLKWRSIRSGHYTATPENWDCSQNPNPRYRSCSAPEEAEESEEQPTPSYQKTHKKQEQPGSRKRERKRSLEVCEFQDQGPKQQVLSHSSSDPNQPTAQHTHTAQNTLTEDQSHAEEDTYAEDQPNTDHLWEDHKQTQTDAADIQRAVKAEVTHTKEKHTETETFIEDKTHTMQGMCMDKNTEVSHTQRLEDKDKVKNMNTSMEPAEREEENSQNRKPRSFYCLKKRLRLLEEQQPGLENMAEDLNPGKVANMSKRLSSEKTEQDSSRQMEVPGDAAQQSTSSLVWRDSLLSSETMMASPLSQREESQSRMLAPVGGNRKAKVQKLAELENEAQRLRRELGLEINKTTQGMMTVDKTSPENQVGGPLTVPAATATREVGCQTDMSEQSTTSSSKQIHDPGPQEEGVQGLTFERPEQNRNRKGKGKDPTQTRIRASDGDGQVPQDTRTAREHLHGIRKNVVVLLTSLLPQLDVAGISMETTDVDNILAQIIEVNSMKL
ncbi:hypothetical protein LDENG_00054710 [Lucifuga dentata]|nr:hypothetical protein LDENG_00054710 [Lucifuga dentata]